KYISSPWKPYAPDRLSNPATISPATSHTGHGTAHHRERPGVLVTTLMPMCGCWNEDMCASGGSAMSGALALARSTRRQGSGRRYRGRAGRPEEWQPVLDRLEVQVDPNDGQHDQRQRHGGGQDADAGVSESDQQWELDRDVCGEQRTREAAQP